jgi:hypothetical protein
LPSKQRRRRKKSLHQVGSPLTPPSSTTRRWHSLLRSFALKQRKGRDYKPRSKKVCYKCGKPSHFIAKCPISSDSDRGGDKRGRRRRRRDTTKRRAVMPMFVWSGTPTRAPLTPPMRTPPTSSSKRVSSSPTSATRVSW